MAERVIFFEAVLVVMQSTEVSVVLEQRNLEKNDSIQEVKLKWFDIRLERNIMTGRGKTIHSRRRLWSAWRSQTSESLAGFHSLVEYKKNHLKRPVQTSLIPMFKKVMKTMEILNF